MEAVAAVHSGEWKIGKMRAPLARDQSDGSSEQAASSAFLLCSSSRQTLLVEYSRAKTRPGQRDRP